MLTNFCTSSYELGALVAEDCAETTYEAEKQKHSKRSREYIPSAKAGSRLPHMLMRALSTSNEVCSIHHLFDVHIFS
jgi:hypothetical protein